MTIDEQLSHAFALGFSVEIKPAGDAFWVTLNGHGTDFPGLGLSVSEALANALASVERLFAEAR